MERLETFELKKQKLIEIPEEIRKTIRTVANLCYELVQSYFLLHTKSF